VILHIAAASNIFSKPVLTSLVAGGLLAGVPLMLTALGETISERAGVLNLGLEGMMLLGAYIGFIAAYYAHSAVLGFLAGMVGGAIGASLMVSLCVWLGLDQIVVGIAITLAGEGITSVLQGAEFWTRSRYSVRACSTSRCWCISDSAWPASWLGRFGGPTSG
jgi:simple sugar transport system permease protein